MALPIKIKLPEHFLDEEVRCGYTVTQELKKIWAVQLDILERIRQVCERHQIHFQVFWGTLLGAIRHKGFIPWDDDLDICMDRENYQKFIKIPQSEFGEPYFLQTALSDREYFIPAARVRNSLTTGAIKGMESPSYNNGIYVDVYVLDDLTSSFPKRLLQKMLKKLFVAPIVSYHRVRCGTIVRHVVSWCIHWVSHMLDYESWVRIYDAVLTMYNGQSDRLATIFTFLDFELDNYITKKEYTSTEWVDFEFIKVPVSCGADHVLTRLYGDYMKFPPVSERGAWHSGIIYYDPERSYRQTLVKI